jgi:hypothetical protein
VLSFFLKGTKSKAEWSLKEDSREGNSMRTFHRKMYGGMEDKLLSLKLNNKLTILSSQFLSKFYLQRLQKRDPNLLSTQNQFEQKRRR